MILPAGLLDELEQLTDEQAIKRLVDDAGYEPDAAAFVLEVLRDPDGEGPPVA